MQWPLISNIAVLRDVLWTECGDAQADRDLQEAGRHHQTGAALPVWGAPAAGGRGRGEGQADHHGRAERCDAGTWSKCRQFKYFVLCVLVCFA